MPPKHVAPGQSTFGRDLAIMVGGIVVVAILVFGGLWLVSNLRGGSSDDATTTTVEMTTTTRPTTTAPTTTSTTTAPTTTTTEPTTTVQEARDPSEVTVLILNSVGSPGLAARVTERLESAGYQTLTPDNYTPELDQTQVWFSEDFGPEAFDLAALFFPDGQVERIQEPAPPGADIVVVLGGSYEE